MVSYSPKHGALLVEGGKEQYQASGKLTLELVLTQQKQ